MINLKTHYSILEAFSKPEGLVTKAKKYGLEFLGIADSNLSGCVKFYKACKEQSIKPLLGLATQDGQLIAKNKAGWQELIKIASGNEVKDRSNLIYIYGNFNVYLSFFDKPQGYYDNEPCREGIFEEVKSYLSSKAQFFPSVYVAIPQKVYPTDEKVDSLLKDVAIELGIPYFTLSEVYYTEQNQVGLHHIQLCAQLKTTINDVKSKFNERPDLKRFFEVDEYWFKDPTTYMSESDARTINALAQQCEDPDILQRHKMPRFNNNRGLTDNEYFKELCREGWRSRLNLKTKEEKNTYAERIKYEFSIIEDMHLEGYFLILQDITKWVRDQNWLLGVSRGCLSQDTTIFTDNGLKNISDIKIGDKVITRSGQFNKVLDVFNYPINEDLLNIKCYYGDYSGVTLTKDHEILVKKAIYPKNWNNWSDRTKSSIGVTKCEKQLKWIRADELTSRDWLFMPFPQFEKTKIEKIDLAEFSNNHELTNNEYFCYHHMINGLTDTIQKTKKYKRFINIDEDFCRILGLFVGDGWLNGTKWKDHIIGMCFNKSEKENIEFVKKYFTKIGADIYVRQQNGKKLVQIDIKCKHLRQFFSKIFCDYQFKSQTKHVPQLMFGLNKKLIKAFLLGCFQSDGCLHRPQINSYSTTSKKLAYELKLLLMHIGVPCSVMYDDHNKNDKRKDFQNWSISYVLHTPKCFLNNVEIHNTQFFKVVNNGFLLRVRDINTVKNISTIYDIKVEGEENYTTSSFLVHNSAGGSLVSYLLGITDLDPIPYGLYFERFLNPARKDAMADIDIDVPRSHRNEVINYIREKYGRDCVSQIITFGEMNGRLALREVLHRRNACTPAEIDIISKLLPDKARVEAQMKAVKEDSLIMWALKYQPENLNDYCRLEDGKLVGDYAAYFAESIELEGTIKSTGKHASAVVVYDSQINEVCPLTTDKNSDEHITQFSMDDAEEVGLLKLDILGLATLDKLTNINTILRKRYEGR